MLDRVFAQLQHTQILCVKLEAVALDRTIVKVYPDGTGALKIGPHAIGQSRGGWTTKIHLVAVDARTAIAFALGQAHDAPEGRKLLQRLGRMPRPVPLLMDRAYEGDATRKLAVE